ncbi:polyketide synthase PksD [Xylaria sp. FL0064]|nr:polyketide synthase PksD [Xylaria sp. FL0064]
MDPIAIVGFSFRLPHGAEDESSFWDMLANGQNVMTEWPESRANIDAFYYPKFKIKEYGAHFLQGDPGAFDAPFFSITPNEEKAASMDPQQRWILEAAYRAMENGGIPAEQVAGSNTAVFAGSMSNDYAKLIYKDPDESPSSTSVGTSPAILANRLSWYFDLKGPSIQLNTACSSSLVAADLACQCLRSGQSSMALVAGSNTIFTPEESLHLENMNFLSPDSRSYSFDYRANGYARGEGLVVLVLKKLRDALRDGDMIRAVIRASASNQDGHTPGITQPSFASQESLIRRVYKSCSLDFKTTRYVEAHGTGTQLGDSTEAKTLGRVFRTARSPNEPLYVGSVKSNIGHLEGASGLAGIMKAIMILERGIIPPTALFEIGNPRINFKFNHLEVPTSCIPWPAEGLRRISVNSFGFGGSNCHFVLDDAFNTLKILDMNALIHTPISLMSLSQSYSEASTTRDREGGEESANNCQQETKPSFASHLEVNSHGSLKFKLLVWSAKDEAGLERILERYQSYFEHNANQLDLLLGPLAFTLSARRSVMPWRSFAVVTNKPTVHSVRISPSKGVRSSKEAGLAFVFTGQGAQYAKMGLDLFIYPSFHDTLSRASNVFRELGADWLLLDELMQSEKIHSPERSQPLCTALQIALVELLRGFGIIPDAVVGHSSGEIAAAYATGALSLESALKVAYHRGRLAQKLIVTSQEPGSMISVNIAESDIDTYLKKLSLNMDIFVACVNSPSNVTLSGTASAISNLERILDEDGVFSRKLAVSVAYHSPAMQQIAADYLLCLDSLQPRQQPSDFGRIVMASSVTGLGAPTSTFSKGQYWVDNLTSPVQFVSALQYIAVAAPKVDGLKTISTYLEVGPHGALKRPVTDTVENVSRGKTITYLSMLSKFESPLKSSLDVVGQLFTHGHPVSVLSANQHDIKSRSFLFLVDTPGFPFNHSLTHWHETRLSRDWRFRQVVPRSILGAPAADWNPLEPCWRKMLRVSETPWLEDHVVGGDVLFPATGSIGMILEAVRQMVRATQIIIAFRIKEASFMKPIRVLKDRDTEVITRLRPLQQSHEKVAFRFEVSLFTIVDSYWSQCVKSIIHVEYEETPNEVDGQQGMHAVGQIIRQNYTNAKERCTEQITQRGFYESLAEQGFEYGDAFSLVRDVVWNGDRLAVARVKVEPTVGLYEGVVHPGVLDAACQLLYVAPTEGLSAKLPTTVPYKMRNVWISATGWQDPYNQQLRVSTSSRLRPIGTGIECTLDVLSDEGIPLCHIDKFDLRPITTAKPSHNGASKLLHQVEWKPHLSLLNSSQLRQYCNANRSVKGSPPIDLAIELENALLVVIRQYLSEILKTDWAKASPHMERYVSFLQTRLAYEKDGFSEITVGKASDDKLKQLSSSRPSWGVFIEVAKNLLPIIRGEVSPSDLLVSSSSTHKYYEDLFARFDAGRLKSYLGLVAHQAPGLKILEIGGGSGALTELVVSILEEIENRVGGLLNCQNARDIFGRHQSRIQNHDFQTGSFDMILSGGCLHAARSLSKKLQDVRRMLKPGGRLLFCDVTDPDDFIMNFGFGILPVWWQELPLTAPKWDALLKENHFSGHDFIITDSGNDNINQVSIMVSTAVTPPQTEFEDAKVVLVVRENEEYQMAIALALARDTFATTKYDPLIVTHSQLADAQLRPEDYLLLLVDISSPNATSSQDSGHSPFSGIKDGFLRTLRSESNNKRIINLTLEISAPHIHETASQISKVFTSAFIQKMPDLEYSEQDGFILTGRLVENAHLNSELSSSTHPETRSLPWLPGPPLKLDMGTRGQLDSLYFVEDVAYYKELGPSEVEIEAKAWAVNFRDVFGALGRLDDPGFGFDCAGIVRRVGAACRSVQPGDRVCMCVVDCMRMYPRGDEEVVVKISPCLSFEEACAVIVPGMTALQSLVEIARIRRGEKVLIHAASGATGQLAIQIAQRAGAEIFATVGYADKKQLLVDDYGIPADHIFYSRSNSFTFAQSIMRATNGYGVDVILNSLVGEGLRASWECIAPYGRFVEIGKADINANLPLPMAPFAVNATFASVDVRHMLVNRKQSAKELLHKTMAMMADTSIHSPRPLHIYDVGAVENAFRYIQSGKNTGRIVIRIESHVEVRKHLITHRTWKFPKDASYIVAGGLGGIGRSLLEWMASRGAMHLIVPSRSGAKSAAAIQVVNKLEKRGVKVDTPMCDVSSWDSLSQTLRECAKTYPRVKGCINAAMVLNDAVFDNMSSTQWDRTVRSKVATSWNLHSLLGSLDFMIFLSSVSGLVGNPGQSNYAAGCAFQDTLAQFRARRGQKTTSIDLEVMRRIGVVAESESLKKHFENGAQGLGQIEDYELFAILDILCDPGVDFNAAPSQVVMGLQTPMEFLARSLEIPETMRRPLFAYFNQAPSISLHNTAGSNITTLFRQGRTAEDRSGLVMKSLASRLARSLAIKPEDVDIGKPLHAFGVDSLVAVELRNWISKEFAADVPVFELIGGRTVEGVGEFVEKCSQIVKRGEERRRWYNFLGAYLRARTENAGSET